MAIDSYRFLDFATRQIMKAWAAPSACLVSRASAIRRAGRSAARTTPTAGARLVRGRGCAESSALIE